MTTDTAGTMTTDLDRLSERVEKAAAMVQQLRDDRARLDRERDELTRRIAELEQKLQGQDPGSLVQELSTLKREQREWIGERREIATRVETLIRKLEKLEA
jgi:chromosome segregation ATPase